jgi:hypothetical protein
MRLYHFTGWCALIGEGKLAELQPGEVDLRTIAAPGSIMADGIKPCKEDGYDHVLRSPLPPCVWLTSDPDMGHKDHMGNHFSKYSYLRITVLITSLDPRLVHWPKYFRKHGQYTLREAMRLSDAAEAVKLASEDFYIYFGEITRITAVSRVEDKAH